MKHRHKKEKLLAVLLCVAAIALGLLALHRWERQESTDGSHASPSQMADRSIESILLMVTDRHPAAEESVTYCNDRQADLLLVMVVDREDQTCRLLHLNRDTMAQLRRPGADGVADTYEGQLALAHTVGSGGSDSCINQRQAVSGFLGVPIDHYVSVPMEAVGILNDLADGVTLEVRDDFGASDRFLEQGKTLTLLGEHALRYIRCQSGAGEEISLHTADRQQQYLDALFAQLRKKKRENPGFLAQVLLELKPHAQLDYTAHELLELGEQLKGCSFLPLESIPGKTVRNGEFLEFYPDQTALEQFREEAFPFADTEEQAKGKK